MTLKSKCYMSYDGKKSEDFGCIHATIDSGMLEEFLLPEQSIVEEKVRGNDTPYFMDTERQPLSFEVTLAFEDEWSDAKMREVTRWLFNHKYYKELYFTHAPNESPERIFYAMMEGSSSIHHTGVNRGYINFNVRCNSPYSYTPYKVTDIYNMTQDTQYASITNLSSGQFDHTIMNGSNVQLTQTKKKWSDFSSTDTWLNI